MKFNKRYNCYVTKNGLVYRYDEKNDKLKLLKISDNRKYASIGLVDSLDNKWHGINLHRLVYMTFVNDIPNDKVIDHIDGNTHNNNIDNLRCVSQKENINNVNTLKRKSITMTDKLVSEFSKKFYQKYGMHKSDNVRFYLTEYGWYKRHNKCRWEK